MAANDPTQAASQRGPDDETTSGDLEAVRRDFVRALGGEAGADRRGEAPPSRAASRYDVGERLGKGGMGEVFRAYDRHVRRDVAIKFAPIGCPRRGDDALRDEVNTLAKVDHPCVPRALDSGEADGFVFAVFPLIRGETLASRIARRRPLPPDDHVSFSAAPRGVAVVAETVGRPRPPTAAEIDRFAEIFSDLSRALDALHRTGRVHADVKPGNIMIDADDRPYLIDFGLATDASTYDVESFGGTDPYMSPEQTLAHGGPLTPASDVYSLAVTLHECLTGRRVATLGAGETPSGRGAVRRRVATSETPSPSDVEPSLRATLGPRLEALETILRTALVKAPEGRYASAGAFADDLDAWRAGRPLVVAKDPRVARAARRRRAVYVALLVAAVLAAVSAYVLPERLRRSERVAALEEALARGAMGDAEAFLRGFERAVADAAIVDADPRLSSLKGRLVEAGAESVVETAFLRATLARDDAADRTFAGRAGLTCEKLLAADTSWSNECAARLAAAAAFAHLRAGRLESLFSLRDGPARRVADDERLRLLSAIAVAKLPFEGDAANDDRAARIERLVGDAFDEASSEGQHLLVASRLCCRAAAFVELATTPFALSKARGRACTAALARAREASRGRRETDFLAALEALCLIADARYAEAETRLRELLESVDRESSAVERPVVLAAAATAAFGASAFGEDRIERRLRRERAASRLRELAAIAPELLPHAFKDMAYAFNAFDDDEARAALAAAAAEALDAVVDAAPSEVAFDDRALRLSVLAAEGWALRASDPWRTLRALADRFAARGPALEDDSILDRDAFRRSFWTNALWIERPEPDDDEPTLRRKLDRVSKFAAAAKAAVLGGGEEFDASAAALRLLARPDAEAFAEAEKAAAALDRRLALSETKDLDPFERRTLTTARDAVAEAIATARGR
jgi:hypothetical protein